MKREQQLPKIPFLNVCATCGITPIGLAMIAKVPSWTVYAMLDKQPVTREAALAVLRTLNDFNPIKTMTYSLENVEVILIMEEAPNEEQNSARHR